MKNQECDLDAGIDVLDGSVAIQLEGDFKVKIMWRVGILLRVRVWAEEGSGFVR